MIKVKNIEELINLWSNDSKIDDTDPGVELSKVSSLHAKYLSILALENLIIHKLDKEYKQLKKEKWEFYKFGVLDKEDHKVYKRFETKQKNILRQDIPIYLDSDPDLINLLLKKSLHEEMGQYCTSILSEIKARTYQLNGIIKWEVFKGGSG
ncbi:MAG: recombination mediator protein UvsY [Candidatus Paceibacterota bacterium]